MELGEFNQVITRIHDAYPKKTYSHDQMMRLYAEVRALTRRNFEDAVISLLDNSSFHPTVNAIRQACRPYMDKLRAETKSFTACRKCYGNGQLDFVDARYQRFAVACPYCSAADTRGLSRGIFPRMSVPEYEAKDHLEKRIAGMKSQNRMDPPALISSLAGKMALSSFENDWDDP